MFIKAKSVGLAISLVGAASLIFVANVDARKHVRKRRPIYIAVCVHALHGMEEEWKRDLRYLKSKGLITQQQFDEIVSGEVRPEATREEEWVMDLLYQLVTGEITQEQFDEIVSDGAQPVANAHSPQTREPRSEGTGQETWKSDLRNLLSKGEITQAQFDEIVSTEQPAAPQAPAAENKKIDNQHQKLECAICLDDIADGDGSDAPSKLSCGHSFHRACITKWAQQNSTCPCCRRQFRL